MKVPGPKKEKIRGVEPAPS